MALMSREVFDALREIGVSEDQAMKTAEALAVPNKDIADIRTDIAVIKTPMEQLQHRLNVIMTVICARRRALHAVGAGATLVRIYNSPGRDGNLSGKYYVLR